MPRIDNFTEQSQQKAFNQQNQFNSAQAQSNQQSAQSQNNQNFNSAQANQPLNQSKGLLTIPPALMQFIPWIPFALEAMTGQKVPAMGGTIGEIQSSLVQIQTNQTQILNNQNQIWTKLTNLENNAQNQFTNLSQQVKSIHSLRLTHSRESKEVELRSNGPNSEENY